MGVSRDWAWLTATALATASATLGIVGLLAHIDESRGASVIAFDVLWILASVVAASVCWRRTRWARRV